MEFTYFEVVERMSRIRVVNHDIDHLFSYETNNKD